MPRMIVGVMDVMENFFWIGIVGALIALLFAYSQAKKVKQYSVQDRRLDLRRHRGDTRYPGLCALDKR